jgi:endonuclease III
MKAIRALVEEFGERFSTKLGIDLSKRTDEVLFKWFLASMFYGARIGESIATTTYKQFEKDGFVTPKDILVAGWDRLVESLDKGRYVRYDFKTADKLLEVSRNLEERYGGSLNALHDKSRDARDLERRLKGLGKGIGDVTVNIFLRELRGIWEKAEPSPQDLTILAAANLGFTKAASREQVLKDLKDVWKRSAVSGKGFPDFEVALLRLGKDFCRKRKCPRCLLRQHCVKLD